MRILPPGTAVSFTHGSTVYEIADYGMIISKCQPNCDMDHDHYEEDYVRVNEIIGTAFPLSTLKHVFDPITHIGSPYNA